MKETLLKLTEGKNLSFDEARSLMLNIMEGKLNNSRIAAALAALKTKGETATEVAAFASAMREKSLKIPSNGLSPIDVCGTGGDNSNTFNISTAAAFVVAGAGVPVAKHGNRSVSSKSGSADVLQELGVNIKLNEKQAFLALQKVGVAFLFAQLYHPAMKFAAPVRKELGIKTIFNILGPLTNPAGVKKQMIGTFNYQTARLMAKAAEYLEAEKICFVCTEDSFDEITLTGSTKVIEYNRGKGLREFEISPENFGLKPVSLESIKGGEPSYNARIILEILHGFQSEAFFVTAANAAMALYAADFSNDLRACYQAALESIKSGKALQKLNELKKFGDNQ